MAARSTGWRRRDVGRTFAVLLTVALAVFALAARAEAHGVLRSSAPAGGATLGTAPRELRLIFSEAVELAVARLELIDPDSAVVALSPLRVGDSASVIVADVTGPLRAGRYTVAWQIVGRDGHPVRGRYTFTIAAGAAGLGAPLPAAVDPVERAADSLAIVGAAMPEQPETLPPAAGFDAESPAFVAVRWLGFAALLGVIGTLGFALVVLPAAARRSPALATLGDRLAPRVRTFGMVAAAALVLAALLRLVAQSAALHGGGGALDGARLAALVSGTRWGAVWGIQLAAAAAALLGFALAARLRAAGWALATGATVTVALTAALSGHAAAVPGTAARAVAADAVHVLAAGGWLGTLLVLAAVGLPAALRAAPDERGATAAALVNAFSPLALACAAIVALTGVVSGWTHLGGLGALTTTGYGRTLLVKLAAVALLVAAGAYNWRRARPAAGSEAGARGLRRSAAAELAIGLAVLAVTAVLVATPTPLDAGP